MVDLQVCSFLRENGDGLRRENRMCTGSGHVIAAAAPPPSPDSVPEETWESAKEVTREIVGRIHPTVGTHYKRKDVVEYIQRLIKSSIGIEVFPYGSVPLKTYLPDGDIDLTAISSPSIEETMFSDVFAILKAEEQNKDSRYEVKDVHCIDAEVKLVKCIVQNIVVDISFNQLGGLSTLCFLEKVDRLIGKNYLFKYSIILIKAWCYYESRILGAHHGLISTYALETLVLYIFNLFHSSLSGPLAVLYRFLDYFSKFDWENYCISLNGPVCKSSLPDVVAAEVPENRREEVLLSDEFLKKCSDAFSVPSRPGEISKAFPLKHLNIVDPLKQNNNLGRSVNRGNFYRIKSAFRYGSHTLGQILSLQREKMYHELNKFFANTLHRHGHNYWTDVQSSALSCGSRNSDNSSSSCSSHFDACFEGSIHVKPSIGSDKDFGVSSLGHSHHYHDASLGLPGENGKSENRLSCKEMVGNFVTYSKMSCTLCQQDAKENHLSVSNSSYPCTNNDDDPSDSVVTSPKDNALSLGERDCGGTLPKDPQSFNSFLNLSGDYDSHFRSLIYGRFCFLFYLSTPLPPYSPVFNRARGKIFWDNVQSLRWKQNAHSQMSSSVLGPQVHFVNLLPPFITGFTSEVNKKRGTGTYIPHMNYHSSRGTLSFGKKTHAPGINSQMHRHAHGNGLVLNLQEMDSSERHHQISESEYPHLGNGNPISPGPLPTVWGPYNANGFSCPSERTNSGSQVVQTQQQPLQEVINLPDSSTSSVWGTASRSVELTTQCTETVLPLPENKQDSVDLLFQLKDEVDFPPLSH